MAKKKVTRLGKVRKGGAMMTLDELKELSRLLKQAWGMLPSGYQQSILVEAEGIVCLTLGAQALQKSRAEKIGAQRAH